VLFNKLKERPQWSWIDLTWMAFWVLTIIVYAMGSGSAWEAGTSGTILVLVCLRFLVWVAIGQRSADDV
jgi:hypothetical protein